ncbi:MAG: hypothetical protein KC456_00620 [Flavobacteriales bacterium]|nr:hypothetical protein [Flavobacteriales bacterium]
MTKSLSILIVMVLCCRVGDGFGQTYSSIDDIVQAYYKAVSIGEKESRMAAYEDIFIPSGTITSVKTSATKPSSVKTLSWGDLIRETAPFYSDFEINLIENEREVDYYLDIATAHTLVNQRSLQKSTGKTYSQFLWIDFDLVYFDDRWYISAINWIDQSSRQPIQNALLTDTLWHQSE